MEKQKREFLRALRPRRVVIKIGSALLADENSHLKKTFLAHIAREVVSLESEGIRCVIVSSGALAAGKEKIGLAKKPRKLSSKQAAAAVGQPLLMYYYSKEFGKFGKHVAQLLLTHDAFEERKKFLNARNTIEALIDHGIIPVINENDTVATEEIKVGDNDALAVRVTDLAGANLLILLAESGGLFDHDPAENKDARRISLVKKVDRSIMALATKTKSTSLGVGGMKSKLNAAKMAAFFGIPVIIGDLRGKRVLPRMIAGEDIGTLFLPTEKRGKSRRHWIAYALTPKGTISVDQGAKRALVENHKSLLPSGIIKVAGSFKKGEPVAISGPEDTIFAKGIASIDSRMVKRIKGKKSKDIKEIVKKPLPEEVVHADNLAILPSP